MHVRTPSLRVRLLGEAPRVRLHHNVGGKALAMSPCCAAVRFGPGLADAEGLRSVRKCLLCVHVQPIKRLFAGVIGVSRAPVAVALAPAESLLKALEPNYSCGT
jgi:hypothetical protein